MSRGDPSGRARVLLSVASRGVSVAAAVAAGHSALEYVFAVACLREVEAGRDPRALLRGSLPELSPGHGERELAMSAPRPARGLLPSVFDLLGRSDSPGHSVSRSGAREAGAGPARPSWPASSSPASSSPSSSSPSSSPRSPASPPPAVALALCRQSRVALTGAGPRPRPYRSRGE